MTDFGLADPYVAAVKGAILSLNPDANIIDLSHDIRVQDIEQGAFVLGCAYQYFPRGTIHLAVVDPGVGSERRALAIATRGHLLVGPDNGILSCALPDAVRQQISGEAGRIRLPAEILAFELTDGRFHRETVSTTFHGRDIFAPVAAHLSLGVDPSELGAPVGDVVALPQFRAERSDEGTLRGRVVYCDRFGNVITTVRADQLPSQKLRVEIAGHVIAGVTQTYAAAIGLAAIVGSWGYLEIALKAGSAEEELGVRPGDPVTVYSG